MASLNTYLKQVQRFTRDANQLLLNPEDLTDYINQARREVAMRAQAIRVLTPVSGAIVSGQIFNGGTGYTNPSAIISPPDSPSGALPFPNGAQATALVTQSGGMINNVEIVFGGAGYFLPTITITDPSGSGAEIKLTTTINNALAQGQEVYEFKNIDVSQFPGVKSVYNVRSISVIYSSYRYSLPVYSFSTYQAMIRQYVAGTYQYVPSFASQLGRGASGSLYLYPLPSQEYQLEFDCMCLPADLTTDDDYEAIPDPWTDAVSYFAGHLAFMELQNMASARGMLELFDMRMQRFGGYVQPGRVSNPNGGRW
jgi:hypothetical protein